jgi:hypothetical protein
MSRGGMRSSDPNGVGASRWKSGVSPIGHLADEARYDGTDGPLGGERVKKPMNIG